DRAGGPHRGAGDGLGSRCRAAARGRRRARDRGPAIRDARARCEYGADHSRGCTHPRSLRNRGGVPGRGRGGLPGRVRADLASRGIPRPLAARARLRGDPWRWAGDARPSGAPDVDRGTRHRCAPAGRLGNRRTVGVGVRRRPSSRCPCGSARRGDRNARVERSGGAPAWGTDRTPHVSTVPQVVVPPRASPYAWSRIAPVSVGLIAGLRAYLAALLRVTRWRLAATLLLMVAA